jgi:hypothetical protein
MCELYLSMVSCVVRREQLVSQAVTISISRHIYEDCGSLPLVMVHLCLLADQVGETASYTRHLGQGIHYLDATIDVGVENTQDVLEVGAYNQVRLRKPR